jgi:hypothetical protein
MRMFPKGSGDDTDVQKPFGYVGSEGFMPG